MFMDRRLSYRHNMHRHNMCFHDISLKEVNNDVSAVRVRLKG